MKQICRKSFWLQVISREEAWKLYIKKLQDESESFQNPEPILWNQSFRAVLHIVKWIKGSNIDCGTLQLSCCRNFLLISHFLPTADSGAKCQTIDKIFTKIEYAKIFKLHVDCKKYAELNKKHWHF